MSTRRKTMPPLDLVAIATIAENVPAWAKSDAMWGTDIVEELMAGLRWARQQVALAEELAADMKRVHELLSLLDREANDAAWVLSEKALTRFRSGGPSVYALAQRAMEDDKALWDKFKFGIGIGTPEYKVRYDEITELAKAAEKSRAAWLAAERNPVTNQGNNGEKGEGDAQTG